MRGAFGLINEDGKLCLATSAKRLLHGELLKYLTAEDKMRVISPDVGGSFGMKGAFIWECAGCVGGKTVAAGHIFGPQTGKSFK